MAKFEDVTPPADKQYQITLNEAEFQSLKNALKFVSRQNPGRALALNQMGILRFCDPSTAGQILRAITG